MTGAVDVGAVTAAASELLAELHAVTSDATWHEPPWSAATWRAMLSLAGVFALLATRPSTAGADRDPVGFVLGQVAGDDVEVLAIGVRPDERRSGIGSDLLNALCTAASEAGATGVVLEVADSNLPARALYDRAGFRTVGRRRGYYRTPGGRLDAVILRRPLDRSQSSRST